MSCESKEELINQVHHWKSNHDNVLKKLQWYTQRPDLKINQMRKRLAEMHNDNLVTLLEDLDSGIIHIEDIRHQLEKIFEAMEKYNE